MAGTCQVFVEKRIEQAEKQRRVFARADEQMLIGNGSGFAATRVDHHQLAAARLQCLQPFFHIRDGHDAAIRCQRITPQYQHEIGVIDVWNRDQQTVAVHHQAGQVMRQLIDRGG